VDSGYVQRHRQSLAAANDVCGLRRSSGDFLTPSPPAEKATARQDHDLFYRLKNRARYCVQFIKRVLDQH